MLLDCSRLICIAIWDWIEIFWYSFDTFGYDNTVILSLAEWASISEEEEDACSMSERLNVRYAISTYPWIGFNWTVFYKQDELARLYRLVCRTIIVEFHSSLSWAIICILFQMGSIFRNSESIAPRHDASHPPSSSSALWTPVQSNSDMLSGSLLLICAIHLHLAFLMLPSSLCLKWILYLLFSCAKSLHDSIWGILGGR